MLVAGAQLPRLPKPPRSRASPALVADAPLRPPAAGKTAALVVGLASGYTHDPRPGHRRRQEYAATGRRAAGRGANSDVGKIDSADTSSARSARQRTGHRPVQGSVKVMTVRGTAFPAATATEGSAAIENRRARSRRRRIEAFVGQQPPNRPAELTAARIIVSGGAAWATATTAATHERRRQTRRGGGRLLRAVDAGFVPNDYQVGQTGRWPTLCAVGIRRHPAPGRA